VNHLGSFCFSDCCSLSMITFEANSRISWLNRHTFGKCSSLSSICIPAKVVRLCQMCFYLCTSLSMVTFEAGSHISCVEESAFANCPSLSSICVPNSPGQLIPSCVSG
jgi:hypothetical protein